MIFQPGEAQNYVVDYDEATSLYGYLGIAAVFASFWFLLYVGDIWPVR